MTHDLSVRKGGGLLGGQNNKFVIQFQKPRGLIRKNTVCIFLEIQLLTNVKRKAVIH